MNKDHQQTDLRAYRIKSLTLLQLMAILATLGMLSTWLLQHFLG